LAVLAQARARRRACGRRNAVREGKARPRSCAEHRNADALRNLKIRAVALFGAPRRKPERASEPVRDATRGCVEHPYGRPSPHPVPRL